MQLSAIFTVPVQNVAVTSPVCRANAAGIAKNIISTANVITSRIRLTP